MKAFLRGLVYCAAIAFVAGVSARVILSTFWPEAGADAFLATTGVLIFALSVLIVPRLRKSIKEAEAKRGLQGSDKGRGLR